MAYFCFFTLEGILDFPYSPKRSFTASGPHPTWAPSRSKSNLSKFLLKFVAVKFLICCCTSNHKFQAFNERQNWDTFYKDCFTIVNNSRQNWDTFYKDCFRIVNISNQNWDMLIKTALQL